MNTPDLTAVGRYYHVYQDGVEISKHTTEREAAEKVYELWAESPDSEILYRHQYEVKVVGSVSSQTQDTEAPTEPQSVQGTAISATRVDLAWLASTDNVGVAGYQILRDTVPIATTTNLSYSDLGLSPSTQYSYEVIAFDAAGNNSTGGGPAIVTTDANSAPVWSLGNQTYDNGQSVSIDLDASCIDADGDTLTFSLVSGALPTGLALSGARNQLLSGTVSVDGTYNFTLGASDGIAAVQTVALTFTVDTPDTTAPGAPTGLAVTATGSNFITLDWADNAESDLASYKVYRSTDGGSNYGLRQSGVLVSTYQDSGLNASTTYHYKVSAVDDSGNESDQSAATNATTDAASTNAYFNSLVAHPNYAVSRELRSAQDVLDAGIDPNHPAYDPNVWSYDAAEDAMALLWEPGESSLDTGRQLRWGADPSGYPEATPSAIPELGTGTLLFVIDWKVDSAWLGVQDGVTFATHKAFQAAGNGTITIEPRQLYAGKSGFSSPNSQDPSAVAMMDVRTYAGGAVAQDAFGHFNSQTHYIVGDRWNRFWLFLDGSNLDVTFWAGDEVVGTPTLVVDRAGVSDSAKFRAIDEFWVEFNTSQPGTLISTDTYFWFKNWVCLRNLSYAEVAALVSSNQW